MRAIQTLDTRTPAPSFDIIAYSNKISFDIRCEQMALDVEQNIIEVKSGYKSSSFRIVSFKRYFCVLFMEIL